MIRPWIALLPLCLGGCGLPPIITAATYVVDGFLLVSTGKSSADHGLSAVTGEDCAAWRFINGDAICEDREMLAQAENAAAIPPMPAIHAAPGPAPRQPAMPGSDSVELKPVLAVARP